MTEKYLKSFLVIDEKKFSLYVIINRVRYYWSPTKKVS